MFNFVTLTGRLTAKPELRTTQTDKKVVSFTLAVPRNGKDAGTDFIPATAWNKTAELIANCDKGQLIGIEARLGNRTVTNKETGKSHSEIEVTANQLHYLSSKAAADKPEPSIEEIEEGENLPDYE